MKQTWAFTGHYKGFCQQRMENGWMDGFDGFYHHGKLWIHFGRLCNGQWKTCTSGQWKTCTSYLYISCHTVKSCSRVALAEVIQYSSAKFAKSFWEETCMYGTGVLVPSLKLFWCKWLLSYQYLWGKEWLSCVLRFLHLVPLFPIKKSMCLQF